MDRFSYEAFKRYEATIRYAVAVMPSEYSFCPRTDLGLSPETVSARIRDAMRGLYNSHKNKTPWVTTVDGVKFLQFYDQIEVCRDGEKVVIRTRRSVVPTPSSLRTGNRLDLGGNPRIVPLVIALVQQGLSGIAIYNSTLTLDDLRKLVTNSDVAIVEEPDHFVLI